MRKTLATLAAVAAVAAAFGTAASPASADDPNVTWSRDGYAGFSSSLGCATQYKRGVNGQYGAWGFYIDGCTSKLTCPVNTGLFQVRYCDVSTYTFIDTYTHRGDRVTMNARLRRFDTNGNVYAWSDKSCDALDTCSTEQTSYIYPGQSASVQCNGVREAKLYVLLYGGPDNSAKDYCRVKLSYR
jgi:hypothetical protein